MLRKIRNLWPTMMLLGILAIGLVESAGQKWHN